MAEHGAPRPQAVPTPAGRKRACPRARICLAAARPRLTGSFGDRWPGWVVAQPLEGVSASQRALGRRCSGVTVCFVCVCCRRLRGQLGPRAAREGLDVAEAARAALGSTPWVCCSCRLAQIVCGRLVGVCRCSARAVTGSGSWWGGGGRWLERLWVGDGTTGARRRPTGAGTSSSWDIIKIRIQTIYRSVGHIIKGTVGVTIGTQQSIGQRRFYGEICRILLDTTEYYWTHWIY